MFMKRQILSFFLLISFVLSISAQKAQTNKAGADEQNLRTHVEYLASNRLEGRRTGATGATYAAGYVSNLFANYKLKAGFNAPGSKGKVRGNYLQTFPLVTGVEIGSGNTFSIDVSKNAGQKMAYVEETAFKPLGFSPNGEIVSRAVVFVGYGIASSELKYDDYVNLDVRNKVVIAFDGSPDADNPHSAFGRYDAHAKAKIAKDKGAVGLLIVSREKNLETDKLAGLKYDATLGEAALPILLISRKSGADVLNTDEAGLSSAEKIAALSKNIPLNACLAANSNATIDFRVNLVKKTAEAYNVVGILEGTDANLKSEAIVIGAHYDHLGRGGQGSLAANSTEIHHGADDNASGVSAMLELARQFAKEKKNKRTLIFIAFGGEEEGLLGSQYYVSNPAFPIAKTVAMINMDMVGRLQKDADGADKLIIGGIGTANEWKNLTETKNKAIFTNMHLVTDGVKTVDYSTKFSLPRFNLQLNEDGFGPSDHSSFYAQKVPVLFFFTGTHNDYHKPSDTSEKINYAGLLKITNFVEEIVKSIDGNPTKPTYAVAKSSGMAGGRSGFNISLGTVPNYADGDNDGLLLDGVRDDSPAAKAGVKAGDKIVKLAGKEVRNISDYTFVLGEMKAGEEYEIVVKRGAENITLKIVPAARK